MSIRNDLPPMVAALVFDFDGTILDTEGPDYQSWQEVYAAHGHNLAHELWCSGIGAIGLFDPYAHLESLLGEPLDRETIRSGQRRRCNDLIALEQPRAGVLDYLATAARLRIPLAVASSSSRAWVSGHLERLGMSQAFAAVLCRDDVQRTKPAPDLFLAAVQHLGVDAPASVAIEDSVHGVTAARTAGLFAVAVPHAVTAALDFSHADLCLPSLADLPLEHLIDLHLGATNHVRRR